MRTESSLAIAPVVPERRSGSVRDRGEEFGIALEAQVSAAENARELQKPEVTSDVSAGAQAFIDPTLVAVGQLASRSQSAEGGIKDEVQNELNSVKKDGDAIDAEADGGKTKRDFVHRDGSSAGSTATGAKAEADSEQVAGVSTGVNRSDVPAAGATATELAKNKENQGKTTDTAMNRPAEIGGAAAAVVAGKAGSENTRGGGSGKHSQVSAVDALGVLGRKTVFKVVVTERGPQADMDKFVSQTAKALAAAVKREGGTVVMRLNPENLGLLKVRVETNAGSVNARVEASESSARQLLVDDVESLRSALEAHGVCVEKIEIVRMDDLRGMNAENAGRSGTDLGNSGRQAEDRQRDEAERKDAMRGGEGSASEFMDEPAGVYLCGVELRVDAMA